MEWLPIETAPKDGTEILLVNPLRPSRHGGNVRIRIGRWRIVANHTSAARNPGGQWTMHGHTDLYSVMKPTHWMPLPEPPSEYILKTFNK